MIDSFDRSICLQVMEEPLGDVQGFCMAQFTLHKLALTLAVPHLATREGPFWATSCSSGGGSRVAQCQAFALWVKAPSATPKVVLPNTCHHR